MANWKKFNNAWWYEDPTDRKWKRLKDRDTPLPVSPPGWIVRVAHSIVSDGPLPPLLVGVTAVLVALVLAIEIVPNNASAVLAPVLTAIGAFTGHAAGHAAAKPE